MPAPITVPANPAPVKEVTKLLHYRVSVANGAAMLSKIRTFFTTELGRGDGEALSLDQYQLATAALLIEVACADRNFERQELEALKAVLARQFQLDAARLQALTELAESEKDQATSLYQFTQLINQQCRADEKYQLMKSMWEIAYADNKLDKYEEHLIRKVADLIYVPHSDFIRAKLEARKRAAGDGR
jgi:uncharacterized tellurite resistance protein B-like protein